MTKLVVIGGNAAGMSPAAQVNRRAPDLDIVVLERGLYTSFAGAGLPYFVSGAVPSSANLVVRTPQEHRARGIDVRTGHEAIAVDPAARTVRVRAGDGHDYDEAFDQLVIATGAAPIRPPIPGIDAYGVTVVHTIPDAERLDEWIRTRSPRHAVVVGGGYTGLEMVEALLDRGLAVTLVEKRDQPLASLDVDMADRVSTGLADLGVDTRFGTSATGFDTEPKGWVRALKGHEVGVATLAFKAGDALYGIFPCRSVDSLLVFGSEGGGSGRVYSCAVSALPNGRGDGQPITSLIDLEPGTQAAHYFAGHARQILLLAATKGFGLLARIGDLLSRQRGGKSFLSLEAGERPLPPSPVDGCDQVACLSLSGRLLLFGLDELKLQPNGGRGLTLIDLEPKDALVSVAAFAHSLQVLGSGRGGKPRNEVLKGAALVGHRGRRARKGRKQTLMPKAERVLAGPE